MSPLISFSGRARLEKLYVTPTQLDDGPFRGKCSEGLNGPQKEFIAHRTVHRKSSIAPDFVAHQLMFSPSCGLRASFRPPPDTM